MSSEEGHRVCLRNGITAARLYVRKVWQKKCVATSRIGQAYMQMEEERINTSNTYDPSNH